MKTLPIIGLILTILALALLAGCAKPIESGDTVSVDYVGKFENGTVFDTSIVSVASDAGLYNPGRTYAPLQVTIGQGAVIFGFEDGLKGMKKGETKTVTIPPELAYGKVSRFKFASFPIYEEQNRTIHAKRVITVPKEVFLQQFPEAVAGQRVDGGDLDYTMLNLTDEAVLRLEPTIGNVLAVPNAQWNATVIAIDDEQLTLRQDPPEGMIIQSALGPARITTTNEKITMHLLLQPGDVLRHAQMGNGVVSMVNETHATIDFNHPLAGKTLVFDLTVKDVTKKK